MANHPDPNQHPDKPDAPKDQPPPGSDTNLGGSPDPRPKQVPGSDSFIDLGMPGGPADPFASGPPDSAHDPSDLSAIEWAALVDEAPEGSSAKFDRPSDQDWVANAGVVPPASSGRPPTQPALDDADPLAGASASHAESPSQTGPHAPPLPAEPPPDLPALSDESGEHHESLAADREVVRQTFNLDDIDSHTGLTPPPTAGTHPPSPPPPVGDEDVFEVAEAAEGSGEFSSSGVDLQQLDRGSFEDFVEEVVEEAAPAKPPSAPAIDLDSAELPRVPPSPSEQEAEAPGRDLIAEAVESGDDLEPLTEAAAEEAVEADEVIESSGQLKRPEMELAGEEEVLGADALVESGAEMKQPLMEIAEEQARLDEAGTEVLEVSDVIEEGRSSSSVNLGAPAETEQLTHEQLDELAAGQELGAAAEQSVRPEADDSGEPAELVEEEIVSEGGEEAGEVIEEVADAAGADAGEIAAAGESDVDLNALLSDSGVKSGADSGVLIEKLDAKEKAEIDPEEVQLGASAPAADDSGAALRQREAEGEMEEVPAAADEEEKKPEKPAKKKSAALPFAGGGLLGALAGAGGCVAVLYFAGLLGGTSHGPIQNQQQRPVQPGPPPVSFEDRLAHLRGGDFAKVEPDKIEGKTPAELAARGEARLGSYLTKQGNALIKKDDESVKQAIDDLTKASQDAADKESAAKALYFLALINERAGDVAGAKKAYQEGAERFKDDPKLKRLFDAALNKLDTVSLLLDPPRPLDEQAVVLAILTCLQPPMQPEDADDEAGFKFWEAVKAARGRNYADALKALEAARALHDKRRFAQLRKAQNPLSDPTEEIFLRACDELKPYWTVQEKLKSGGYLTAERKDPVKAVEEAMTRVAAAEKKDKELGDKLVQAKVVAKPEDVGPGIDKLLAERKTAETTIAKLNKDLTDQKKAADTTIDGLNKQLAEQKKTSDTAIANAKAETMREAARAKTAEDLIGRVRGELVAAERLNKNADNAKMIDAVKDTISAAKAADPMGTIRKLQGELNDVKAALAERRPPADMLAVWLPALEDRSKAVADGAVRDAERVLKDAKGTPAQKARAKAVLGLALRNEEKFPDAKNLLEEAKRGAGGDTALTARIDAALKEVSDPTATYLARVDALRSKGDYDGAVAALTKTIDALPPEKRGDLLAERGLLRLEAARAKAKGPLQTNDPLVAAAHQDAKAAAAAGAKAAGFYAEGRVAEEVGNWPAAVASYRAAVGAHEAVDAQGSRYRVALARALLQAQGKSAPPKEPGADTTGRLPRPEGAAEARAVLSVLLATALQPAPLPPASVEEAQKLADEVLKQEALKPGTVPFDVLAQAKAVKGLYTEALKTYAAGLRTKLPPEYADGLMQLIESHPTLKRPDSLKIANPLTAEKHYGAGLRWYNDRNYANAEKEFAEAIQNDGLDARYHYFLGLARLAQNKPEAAEDFAQGAKLEAQGRPPRGAVSAALERVQGPMRNALNEARSQPK